MCDNICPSVQHKLSTAAAGSIALNLHLSGSDIQVDFKKTSGRLLQTLGRLQADFKQTSSGLQIKSQDSSRLL